VCRLAPRSISTPLIHCAIGSLPLAMEPKIQTKLMSLITILLTTVLVVSFRKLIMVNLSLVNNYNVSSKSDEVHICSWLASCLSRLKQTTDTWRSDSTSFATRDTLTNTTNIKNLKIYAWRKQIMTIYVLSVRLCYQTNIWLEWRFKLHKY